MAKTGDDCYFFYNQTCIKGELCPYRHVKEAKGSTVTCDKWRMQLCNALPCPLRHMELQQNVPCFYETQPGGCTRPNCVFRHKFSKQQTAPPGPVPVSVAPVPARNILQRPPVSAGPVPVIYNRPPPPPRPGWQGAGIGPAQMFPGPPITRPPPGFPPFHPGASLPPAGVPLMQIDPVIINPNEESDQDSIKGSPMKVVTRVQPAVPPHTQIQSSNPLDYFLNAKPWVDTSQRNVYKRSPSPSLRRSRSKSPRRSLSPRRSVSPRRSQSPSPVSRQRSLSAERYSSSIRRRSGSLDRSRSPEWRDSRRFGRRSSRSPPRRRSRSPNRDRERGILNKFRQGGRGRKLQEVKVTGSKIISIKKDKKQEKEEEEEKEKQTEKKEEKVDKVKSDRSKVVADIVKEDVKSLEDIYRERALQSLMDAKRKKILENKRKRWENVGAKKVSESEKSDKSGKQSGDDEDQSNVDEKGDNKNEEVDSSSDSADEGGDNKSDIDLPDDIDIEIGEGDLEEDNESDQSESDKESEHDKREEDLPVKHKSKSKSSVSIPAKPSIKSRLGLKPGNANPERRVQENVHAGTHKRSVKERLGIKDRLGLKTNPVSENSVRSNKNSRGSVILSRLHTDMKERKSSSKNILMVPQITIKNQSDIEDRKAGIFQRLGLKDDEENDSDSKKERKRKRGIDEELMKLLHEQEAEIEEEDLELLSKKEKKKLLKRLLTQQGREEEYELLRKKKKKGLKKKREYKDQDEERESKRKINVQSEKADEDAGEDVDLEDLQSEDEIQLEEEETEIDHTEEVEKEKRIVKSKEDIQREKDEKELKLREALEPKSLDDIRKERAMKKSQPGDTKIKIAQGQNKRKIVVEEDQPPKVADRPVHITFHGIESAPKRKLIRIGKEQIENNQPVEAKSTGRGFKRERQIYIPPTAKRTVPEEPVTIKKVGPPKGREIIQYEDMFSKKSTPAVEEKKSTVRLTKSASESVIRPRLQLNRGPPKVEVKDATVKTFAEIMAEKKRKRMLAQQEKPYTPISFDDKESSQGSISADDRLSPTPSQSTISSSISNVSSPVKTLSQPPSASNTEKTETKSRWKKRKTSIPEAPAQEKSVTDTQKNKFEITKDIKQSSESDIFVVDKSEKVDESGFDEEFTSLTSVSPVKTESSNTFHESKKGREEKKSISKSFMDFEDDLLNMDDDDDIDLELDGGGKDTDELMREIDEMLS